MKKLSTPEPFYQQVYKMIKESIFSGDIPFGSELVVNQLQKDFRISRTPIREALRQLENEGLVIQDKMGATVIELNKSDFKDLCECRLILEKEIITLTINKIGDKELSEMKNILDQVKEEADRTAILNLNTKFHSTIAQCCPNKVLKNLLMDVRSMMLLYRANIVRNSSYNTEVYSEHVQIYNSIKSGDLNKTISNIEKHLLNDKERFLNSFDNNSSESMEKD